MISKISTACDFLQIWEPLSELSIAQEEVHQVAHYLDTEAIVGSRVTKEMLLTELPKATLVHLGMTFDIQTIL